MDISQSNVLIWNVVEKHFGPPFDIKAIGKDTYMIDFWDEKLKVRTDYKYDKKKREKSFLEILDLHRLLQEEIPGVPKIVKFVDEGIWKYKFVEWMEGETFIQLSKSCGSRKNIPEETFYRFGEFMWRVEGLGWYGQDGYWGNPFLRTDKEAVVVCDYGSWSFSCNKKYEEPFIEQFLKYAIKIQRRAFCDGYQYTTKKY